MFFSQAGHGNPVKMYQVEYKLTILKLLFLSFNAWITRFFFSPLKTEIWSGRMCRCVKKVMVVISLILGKWHSDNETHGKVTVNVTQIKLGISILIFWLPSDLQWIIMFKSPPPPSPICQSLLLYSLSSCYPPSCRSSPSSRTPHSDTPPLPSNTTTTDSVAGNRHCERVLYPKSSLVLNR